MAGVNQPFEMVRHLRNGRRLEKPRNLELDLRNVVDVAENVGGQERVSARREEVIVNTDLLDLEDLCPVLGQHLLERRPWRDEGPRQAQCWSRDPAWPPSRYAALCRSGLLGFRSTMSTWRGTLKSAMRPMAN